MRRALVGAGLALGLGLGGEAEGCSTCACGDPTLTVMGAEQPFAHRIRASAAVRTSGHGFGPEGARTELSEQRFELAVSYSPFTWLGFSLSVPLVRRQIDFANLARDETFALGDVELRARAFVVRDRDFAPRHLLALVAGLEMPTAASWTPAHDARPLELQIGSGSWDPLFGVSYAFFAGDWSVYASTTVLVPTPGFDGARQGLSSRTGATVQLQPWTFLGFRAGLEARGELAAQGPEGDPDPNSGGLVGFTTLGLVSSPLTDLVVQATIAVPVVQAFRGEQSESVAFTGGVAYDL